MQNDVKRFFAGGYKRQYLRTIARKHGVSVDEVLAEMQASINAAFENPTLAALHIPRKNAVPTVLEFLEYTQNQLKNK